MSTLSNESELCPWDDRRLRGEISVKLFVVQFTVIGAYAHLMHLRREPRGIFSFAPSGAHIRMIQGSEEV